MTSLWIRSSQNSNKIAGQNSFSVIWGILDGQLTRLDFMYLTLAVAGIVFFVSESGLLEWRM
jgi:hypothetical protein